MATASQEGDMFAAQGAVQEVQNARIAIGVIAVIIVVFWRAVLRLLLAIIVAALVFVVGAGALVLLHSGHG
jgi:hypothetical protein